MPFTVALKHFKMYQLVLLNGQNEREDGKKKKKSSTLRVKSFTRYSSRRIDFKIWCYTFSNRKGCGEKDEIS